MAQTEDLTRLPLRSTSRRQALRWAVGAWRSRVTRFFTTGHLLPRGSARKINAVLLVAVPIIWQFALLQTRGVQISGLFIVLASAWIFLLALNFALENIQFGEEVDEVRRAATKSAYLYGDKIEKFTRYAFPSEVPEGLALESPHPIIQGLVNGSCSTAETVIPHKKRARFCSTIVLPSNQDSSYLKVRWYSETGRIQPKHYTGFSVDAPGAGKAFQSLVPQTIEDVNHPMWDGYFGGETEYRSIAAFPIVVGGVDGTCFGCLVIDCSQPHALNPGIVNNVLSDTMAPFTNLLGLVFLAGRHALEEAASEQDKG